MNEIRKSKQVLVQELEELRKKVGEYQQIEERFRREIQKQRAGDKIQSSLYQISEAAHDSENLEELFHKIHQIISGLMAAENFYIALYDSRTETLHFPYFVDQYDRKPEPKKPGKGLTEYVLRSGEPLLASPEIFDSLVGKGEVESIGAPSIDWLGVPLKIYDKIIGVLVLQSYREGIRYSEDDKNLLMFVSSQVAMAIERKRAEEAIGQAKRQWERTFDSVPDLIAILDRDFRIVRINRAMAERLRITPREAIGLKCHKTVHGLEQHPPDCPHALLLLDRKEHGQEIHERNIGGDFFVTVSPLFDSAGELTGSVHVARDITERVKAESALRDSEEKYRRLFEESKDMIYMTTPSGKFLDINPAGVSLLGYGSKEELLQTNVREAYLNGEDRDRFLQIMSSEGFVRDLELQLKRKDGEILTILITSTAIRDPSGAITALRGIVHDITERRRLELQLFQSQKMESIGTLAGGIAHDFNNILSGILGYASFMREKIDVSHPFFSYIDIIQRGAKRAAELTSKLLAFARDGSFDVKPVNINRVVVETLSIIERTFEKSIEVKSVLADGLPTVEIDPVHIQQVLMNLVVNARDAMPNGGRLIVETGIRTFSGLQIRREIEGAEGTYVVVSVEDSGQGMDKNLMQRIFDPFFTTKEKGRGTGLGLSMVYGVVRNHGGFIRVYSEPGQGSVFRVYLPVSGKPEIVSGEESNDRELRGNERILVVDDEEDIRTFLGEIFKEYGYQVELAENGRDALTLYGENKDRIDLVILDMIMPKLGGRETFLKLKEIDPHVRVLLSTGYSQNGKAQEIIGEGMLGFIQKPYQVNELLSKVRLILDGSKQR